MNEMLVAPRMFSSTYAAKAEWVTLSTVQKRYTYAYENSEASKVLCLIMWVVVPSNSPHRTRLKVLCCIASCHYFVMFRSWSIPIYKHRLISVEWIGPKWDGVIAREYNLISASHASILGYHRVYVNASMYCIWLSTPMSSRMW